MSILQVAGEDESWDILNGGVDTGTAGRRAAYARCSIHSNAEDGVQIIFRGALKAYLDAQPEDDKDFWFGYRFTGGGGFLAGNTGLKLYDSADKCFMRLRGPGTADLGLQLSPGGTFAGLDLQDYPSSVTGQIAPAGNPFEWTFRVKIHPTNGHVAWYINGGFWFQTPLGDTTALCTGSPKQLRFGNPNSNGNNSYSEFIATSADDPRVGMNLNTLAPTANGALTGWSGGFADIGEVTESTATLLQTAVAATDSTFVPSPMVALAGSIVVRALVLSGKFAAAVGAPQNAGGLLRIGGVTFSSALQTVNSVLELRQFIFAVSPATGIRFTEAEANASEYGVRSAA